MFDGTALREQGKKVPMELKDAILVIGQRCAALPDKDTRTSEVILGYDDQGLPH